MTFSNILILGDSETRSAGDTRSSPTGQGDYLGGTVPPGSPTPPAINIGNYAWMERSLAGIYSYMNLSVQGKTAAAYTAALMPKQLAIVDKAPPTHAVITTGVNDFMTGANAATVETRNKNIMAMLRARYPGTLCFTADVLPVTNSNNGWIDLAGQFLSGTLPNGVTPAWANFTDNTGTSGRSLYNARANAGLLGADGHIPTAAVIQAASDVRYFADSATSDGIHPNYAYHILLSQCYDPETYFG